MNALVFLIYASKKNIMHSKLKLQTSLIAKFPIVQIEIGVAKTLSCYDYIKCLPVILR
jgi:hypothetical protein